MKLTQTLFLLIVSTLGFSQTKLDSLVFVEINNYRISNGLNTLELSDVSFKAANHHSKFLLRTGKVGHTEDTLTTVSDRVKFYGLTPIHIGENVSSLSINVKDSDTQSLNKVAKEVVKSWINSTEHNAILLSDFKLCGVSCVVVTKSVGIKECSNFSVISTLVLIK